MPFPYSNCTQNETLPDVPQYRYSVETCLSLCLAHHIKTKCDCNTPYWLQLPQRLHDDYCGKLISQSMTDEESIKIYKTKTQCERNVSLSFNKDTKQRHDCGCFTRCNDIIYSNIVAVSRYPMKTQYAQFLKEEVIERTDRDQLKAYQQVGRLFEDDLDGILNHTEMISDNFARVNIFLKQGELTERTQIPAYKLHHLIAEIGGISGLWLGISFLGVLEGLQLLLQIFWYLLLKRI